MRGGPGAAPGLALDGLHLGPHGHQQRPRPRLLDLRNAAAVRSDRNGTGWEWKPFGKVNVGWSGAHMIGGQIGGGRERPWEV